jgi:hypothetical protein
MDLMARAQWDARALYRVMGEWGLRHAQVSKLAAEAGRRIHYVCTDGGLDMKTLITTGVQSLAADAITHKDRKNAIAAFKLLADLHGLITQKHDVTIDDYSTLSDEQLEEKRQAVIAALSSPAEGEAKH